jgi:threonine dehydratase
MSVSHREYSAADVAIDVERADARIRPYIRETPIEESFVLSQETGAHVLLKLESAQVSGSFKARGAFNKLLSLTAAERTAGIVTASTGNHALATAHALATLGLEGEIFLPATASANKVDALRARGAHLRLVDADPGAVEVAARAHAGETGRVYVSPYNDPEIIGGQGTIASELARSLASFDTIVVPVGGGGLIAGIAGYLKETRPTVGIVGCQPTASAVMARSVEVGHLVEFPSDDSISDATVGLVERGSITFPICQACVDEWVLVDEPDLRSAVRLVAAHHSFLIEGAAALAVAALRRTAERHRGKTVVLVLSGSHIGLPLLASILADQG